MIELPYIFVSGILGSAHCLGMCGPLAISLSAGVTPGVSLWRRQMAFSFGRVFTYCFCGGVAGFAGAWVTSRGSSIVLSQATLAIIAGVALVFMGLITAGVLSLPASRFLGSVPCGAGSWLKTFLVAPGLTGPLVAGVFTGFIPCGLVYAFLLKASSSGTMGTAILTMLAFGSGTIPMMVAVGFSGQFIPGKNRATLFKIAAWCIVVTGIISIARGAVQFQSLETESVAPCPFCEATTAAAHGS